MDRYFYSEKNGLEGESRVAFSDLPPAWKYTKTLTTLPYI